MIARNEIRSADGIVLAFWMGEGTFDWGAHIFPDVWELWRDDDKLARYWRTADGWAWETYP